MQADYQPFIDRVIQRYEGGYGWNAKDPGGPTKYGITCYDLAQHRGQKMTSMSAWVEPVKNLTLAEAEAIYKTKYATAVHFDTQPAGLDCCMVDYAINSGIGRPTRVLDALGTHSPSELINAMCDERLRFMHAIRGGSAWTEFGHGWGTRVADVRSYCLHLASGAPIAAAPPAPDLSKVVTPKATNVGKTATKSTTGGVVAAGTAAHASGLHWLPTVGVCAAVLVAGIGYEIWQEHSATVANNTVHI